MPFMNDALDPERAEGALAVAPVAISVLQALLDPLDGGAEDVLVAAAVALGLLDDFAVTGVRGDAPFYTGHDDTSFMSSVRQEVALDDPRIGVRHDAGAAGVADHLLGALAHAVALIGVVHPDLAGGREAEPLLGTALGLELGHFAILCFAGRRIS
jgi:hypothetical protein